MFGADTPYPLEPMDSKALKQLLELEHTMLDIKAGCLPANQPQAGASTCFLVVLSSRLQYSKIALFVILE